MFDALYEVACLLYSNLFGAYQDIKLRSYSIQAIQNTPVHSLDIEHPVPLPIDSVNIRANNYCLKHILTEDDINKIIVFFDKHKVFSAITQLTGFRYCIDFISFYTTSAIPLHLQKEHFFANHYHRDKPFSRNMLKLWYPVDVNSIDGGELRVLASRNSRLTSREVSVERIFSESSTKIHIFNPSIYYHKLSVPEQGSSSSQLMIQLNPADTWRISSDLYSNQLNEPRFPDLFRPSSSRIASLNSVT
tara:strand:- start:90 stop:830 length:741 start_codon:yes stop_codon:yes gene_type:complete